MTFFTICTSRPGGRTTNKRVNILNGEWMNKWVEIKKLFNDATYITAWARYEYLFVFCILLFFCVNMVFFLCCKFFFWTYEFLFSFVFDCRQFFFVGGVLLFFFVLIILVDDKILLILPFVIWIIRSVCLSLFV